MEEPKQKFVLKYSVMKIDGLENLKDENGIEIFYKTRSEAEAVVDKMTAKDKALHTIAETKVPA